MRWNVVQTVPSPRLRAASMNDHAAGTIEPNIDATSGFDLPSYRPTTHGMTWTGTSWMCSARWTTASPIRAIWPSRGPPPRWRYGNATSRHSSPSRARFSASVTTTKCQFCE